MKRTQAYWRQTKLLAVLFFIFYLILLLAALIGFSWLNQYVFLGFPLGVFCLCLLVPVFAIILIFRHVTEQDHIDEHYGVNEDI